MPGNNAVWLVEQLGGVNHFEILSQYRFPSIPALTLLGFLLTWLLMHVEVKGLL